ncbi:hypothetical protein E2C01_049702 [Portunus trituberculatus]|uniref:Uncharacterized protein n=1 Tax=Portunus trituberculatus TaxID=210409 RepID=A0A5B7GF24_PORTR|nr:hypothetical protein [Portunus trituberculatus]
MTVTDTAQVDAIEMFCLVYQKHQLLLLNLTQTNISGCGGDQCLHLTKSCIDEATAAPQDFASIPSTLTFTLTLCVLAAAPHIHTTPGLRIRNALHFILCLMSKTSPPDPRMAGCRDRPTERPSVQTSSSGRNVSPLPCLWWSTSARCATSSCLSCGGRVAGGGQLLSLSSLIHD